MSSENTLDKLLQIKTTGRDESGADEYHHPYEPTPYCVLERLENSGLIGKDDAVLDYGCGKGRVGFFLSYRTKAKTMTGSGRVPWRTGKPPFPESSRTLC